MNIVSPVQNPESPRETPATGNYLSRLIFESDLYRRLSENYPVDQGMVTWDVGVPILTDNRPVLDDQLIRDGNTQKFRLHLGIKGNEDSVTVSLSDLHMSQSNTETLPIKPPVMGETDGNIFAIDADYPEFTSLEMVLRKSGEVSMAGKDAQGEAQPLFSGNSLADPDYGNVVSLIRRMIVVPFLEGKRRPIATPAT